jgi:hypothetical protein
MRTLAMLSSRSLSRWDRQFESGLLQRGVGCELDFLDPVRRRENRRAGGSVN